MEIFKNLLSSDFNKSKPKICEYIKSSKRGIWSEKYTGL